MLPLLCRSAQRLCSLQFASFWSLGFLPFFFSLLLSLRRLSFFVLPWLKANLFLDCLLPLPSSSDHLPLFAGIPLLLCHHHCVTFHKEVATCLLTNWAPAFPWTCWHYDTSLALWHRCCPWWKLTQMEDLSSGSQNGRKRDIRRFLLTKLCIHVGSSIRKCVCVCMHFHAWKSAYMWENLLFSPWYLALGIWTYGCGPWYCVWSVEPRYWVLSIGSKWFWIMVLSKA